MAEKPSSNAPVLRPGDVVNNRYQIRDELGSGNFSNVYSCVDLKRPEKERDAHPLALKILKKEYKSDAYFEKKMLELLEEKDTESTARVCKMYDFFEWKELPIFIMPVHGAPLRSRKLGVGRGVVTRTNVIQFAYELLETLNFIHFTCNMVHTDLKPENILLADRLTPATSLGEHWVVCDFGSASQWDMKHLDSDLISTRPYRAPEVVLGSPWFYAADVWSAGCIIFEVAVGNRLFEVRDDNTHLQLMAKRVGPLPELFTVKSRYSPKFFNRKGELLAPSEAIRSGKLRTTPLKEVFHEDAKMLELLMALLTYDPRKRISASKALLLPLFDRLREQRRQQKVAPAAPPTTAAVPHIPTSAVAAATPADTSKPPTLTSPAAAFPPSRVGEASPTPVSKPAAGAAKPTSKASPIFGSESEEEEDGEVSVMHRPQRAHSTALSEANGRATLPTMLPLPVSKPVPANAINSNHSATTSAGVTKDSPLTSSEAVAGTHARPSPASLATAPAAGASTSANAASGPLTLSTTQTTPAAANTGPSSVSYVQPLSTVAPAGAGSTSASPLMNLMSLATPTAAKDKDKGKDKKRKGDAKSASTSARGQLNVDDLSTILLTEEALDEAVQNAADKRRTNSKHARKSASGYLVNDSANAALDDSAAPRSPASLSKDKSSSSLNPPEAMVAAAGAQPSTTSARTKTAPVPAMTPVDITTTRQTAILTSLEKGGVSAVRPLSAVAAGGTRTTPSHAGVLPLTVESIVAPVESDGAAMTAFETSAQRGARSARRTSVTAEGSCPRLQRSVSRDRAGGPNASSTAASREVLPTTTGGAAAPALPSPPHSSTGPKMKKVRRSSMTGSSTRTPRSPRVSSGRSGPTTPRTKATAAAPTSAGNSSTATTTTAAATSAGGASGAAVVDRVKVRASGVPISTTSGTHQRTSSGTHQRTSSNAHSTSVLSKDSSTTFEPHSPLSPRKDKDVSAGGDAQNSLYRMHRMPPALAAKSQRAANHRRNIEAGTTAGPSAGPASQGPSRGPHSPTGATATKLVVSRPGPSAAPQTIGSGGGGGGGGVGTNGSDAVASKANSAINSHSTRTRMPDEESEAELLSNSVTRGSSNASSMRAPAHSGGGDVAHTVIADNRVARAVLMEAKAPPRGGAGAMTTNALSVDELVPVATFSPYHTGQTSREGARVMSAGATPSSTTNAPPPPPPPVTAGRRAPGAETYGHASTTVQSAQRTMRPFTAMPYGDVDTPDLSTTTVPETMLRDETFFLDAPSGWSTHQIRVNAQGGLRPSESPSPGLEPSAGLQPMAASPHSLNAKSTAGSRGYATGPAVAASADGPMPTRFPQFPCRLDGLAPARAPDTQLSSAPNADGFVREVSAATSTTSFGTAERQMRAMIAKPRGLAVSSSSDDEDARDHRRSAAAMAPLSYGAAGLSPYGTAHVPFATTAPTDSDACNFSQGSVDRLVAALYGGTNLDSTTTTAPTSGAMGGGPTKATVPTPGTSATTVHAMPAPSSTGLSYAGVKGKPLNLANIGAALGNGPGSAPTVIESGPMFSRSPRARRKQDRQRAATGVPGEAGKAGTAPRGRRSMQEASDPLLDELLLQSATPYVVPHANAAVRLPYTVNGFTPHSPSGTGPGYYAGANLAMNAPGANSPPQTRSPFSGLLPPTGYPPSAGNATRHRVPEAMPARPIRPDAAPTTTTTNTNTMPVPGAGRSLNSTSGAGYSG